MVAEVVHGAPCRFTDPARARKARPRFSPRLSTGPVMQLRLVAWAKGATCSAPLLIDPANPSQGRV